MKPYYVHDIEADTLANNAKLTIQYEDDSRKGARLQVALSSVAPLAAIEWETHWRVTQFVRVEAGRGTMTFCDPSTGINSVFELRDGVAVVVPAGISHRIYNTSKEKALKLYSVYVVVFPFQGPLGLAKTRVTCVPQVRQRQHR